jgi:diguanylate cyclase (GGDEF)-like protein
VIWYAADLAAGASYSAAWIPVWNALVRLAFFVVIADLVRRLRAALDAQRRLAEVDELTGLANGRRFQAAVDAEVARSVRYRRPVSLAYIDLDGFKAVNDRWGHPTGDTVLTRVGSVLRTQVRATDVPGRLGGDEFAVLLPETDAGQAGEAMAKMRPALEEAMAQGGWPVGFSVGVVSSSGDVATGQDLLRLADGLMYEVKRSGKGRTRFRAGGA